MDGIKSQFPIFSREINGNPLVYLDNAATTQKPQSVIDALVQFYTEHNANIHRGIHTLSVEATNMWEDAHKKVADFIGAEGAEEIIFNRNATEGLNLLAQLLVDQHMKEGDVVVISEMEHHSNIVPWQIASKRKSIKIEWIPILPDFSLDLQYLEFLLRKYKEKIKVVSMVHLSNVLGVKNDIEEVVKLAKSVGALTLVDAAQSVQKYPIDVKELGVDMLVFSGHKIYGPTGIGVLYMRKELGERFEPWMQGGEMVSRVWKTGAEWNDLPWKFEAGTPAIADGVALAKAIEWFRSHIDYTKQSLHFESLNKVLLAGLRSIPGVSVFGITEANPSSSIVTISVTGAHPHDISSILDQGGVAVRAGYHCAEPLHKKFEMGPTLRVSYAPYNSTDDIRIFLDQLKKSLSKLRR